MNSIPTKDDHQNMTLDYTIFIEQLKILHRRMTLGLPANIICPTVIVIGSYNVSQPLILFGWYTAILSLSIIRQLAITLFPLNAQNIKKQYYFFITGVLLSGLIWGYAGYFLMPPDHLRIQMLITLIIAGMTAGALQTLQASLLACLTFTITAVTPMAVWFFIQGLENSANDVVYELISFSGFVYLFLTTIIALNGYRMVLEVLKLRFQNVELVDTLTKTNDDLRKSEELLSHIAYHDILTGLDNRALFQINIRRLILDAKEKHISFAILLLDLDDFKGINDNFGHHAGDELLKVVASRLKMAVRKTDFVARLGGDEFVIMLPDITHDKARQIVNHIQQCVNKPVELNGITTNVTVTIGMSMYPENGEDMQTLLNNADRGMYKAKKEGKNRFSIYESQTE